MSQDNELFICECEDECHQILFQVEGTDRASLRVAIHLNPLCGFLDRIWLAIKYVFGCDNPTGHYLRMAMKADDMDRLISVLSTFKNKADELEIANASNPAPDTVLIPQSIHY